MPVCVAVHRGDDLSFCGVCRFVYDMSREVQDLVCLLRDRAQERERRIKMLEVTLLLLLGCLLLELWFTTATRSTTNRLWSRTGVKCLGTRAPQ